MTTQHQMDPFEPGMDPFKVSEYIELCIAKHYAGTLSRGQLLRTLRKDVLSISQTAYCRLCGIGRNSLNDLEQDKGDLKESTISSAFRPFGLVPGMIKPDPDIYEFIVDRVKRRHAQYQESNLGRLFDQKNI
jgi:hypothetical protein